MKKFLKNICVYVITSVIYLPAIAYGQLKNPLKFQTIPEFLAALLDIVVKIGIPLAILFIIYSGFLFVRAQGSDDKLKEAKKALGWTLVGTAILLGAWAISEVIQNTVDQFKP